MKKHPLIGYDLFKNEKNEILNAVSLISLHHHEKWDWEDDDKKDSLDKELEELVDKELNENIYEPNISDSTTSSEEEIRINDYANKIREPEFKKKGYPQGLKGIDIHIYGRITALADVYDALGSDRYYKDAWEDDKIYNLLEKEKGWQFEPKLIDLFFENKSKFEEIRDKYKDI